MWGTHSPRSLCRAARALGYDRLALTDTDNLYGLWPFLNACKEEGLAPVIGAEITDPNTSARAVCLVKEHEGYQNLCRLITARKTDPAFDLKTALGNHANGLAVLTRSEGLLTSLHEAAADGYAAAPRKPTEASSRLRKLAGRLGAPFVATPGSFFLEPADFTLHQLLRAIDLNTSIFKLTPKDMAPGDAFLAPPDVYRERFAIWPEAIKASRLLAENLAFTGPDQTLVMPPLDMDPSNPRETAAQRLRKAAYEGAKNRYGDELSETVVDRLEHELAVIERMGFPSYFLVVRDIVLQSPRICGRGSGAASLVAYCLSITNVCPVKHNLYFERFLNPGRKDPPDIDVDFAWDERDAVMDAVLSKYNGHAARVCNHVGFKPRMAIRETAKVFGLADGEISRVCKRLPWFWRTDFEDGEMLQDMQNLPELSGLDFPPPWPEILGLAQRLIRIPRYISVHSGGVIITPSPLADHAPMETAPKGVPIIQWEKDGTEESGLVKIDLLGNRSLGVIRDTLANLKENGIPLDEKNWEPEDDPATRRAVARGETMGCFYIESPAMRLLQQKTGKGDFEHLVIHSSIIRPAANEFIREYIRRLHGGAWKPIHPLLGEVLEETYGIMVYQEDVSKTAVALAGFSHADADGLRKIMSKKDKARQLKDYKERFFSGARANGLSGDQIQGIWDMMMSFSGYSFCKPHSASYARVSFQAAYLKTHFPAEFMAAVISNQGGFYSAFAYVSEAMRLGVTLLPPDVNASQIRWRGNGKTLRVGFLSVKHLSAITRERIIARRQVKPFQDLPDFLNRARPDDREMRSLIHAGTFASLAPDLSPADLLWEYALYEKQKRRKKNQGSLFEIPESKIPKPVFPEEDPLQHLRNEFSALGFLCARHPMTLYADKLSGQGIIKAKDLRRFTGKTVKVAGLLITGKVVHTRSGDPMEFLTFEDETGTLETVFFPDAYHRFCAILDKTRPFVLTGRVEEDFGALTLTVSHARSYER
jgi:DNA polymerase-3 subunit alpha/error-prone DNA polymerase